MAQFEELLAECRPRLLRYAYSVVEDWDIAEDVMQEASLRAWQGFAKWRGETPFANWLGRIVANEAKRHLSDDDGDLSLEELMDDGWDVADEPDVIHF